VCNESATAGDVRAAMPHPVAGSAADPVALAPLAAGIAQAPVNIVRHAQRLTGVPDVLSGRRLLRAGCC
jgi:hypothetical protein